LLSAITIYHRHIQKYSDIAYNYHTKKPSKQWCNSLINQIKNYPLEEISPKSKQIPFNLSVLEIICSSKSAIQCYVLLKILMHKKTGINLNRLASLSGVSKKQVLQILRRNKFYSVIRTSGTYSDDIIKFNPNQDKKGLIDIRKEVTTFNQKENTENLVKQELSNIFNNTIYVPNTKKSESNFSSLGEVFNKIQSVNNVILPEKVECSNPENDDFKQELLELFTKPKNNPIPENTITYTKQQTTQETLSETDIALIAKYLLSQGITTNEYRAKQLAKNHPVYLTKAQLWNETTFL
jgi:hypothetical protein